MRYLLIILSFISFSLSKSGNIIPNNNDIRKSSNNFIYRESSNRVLNPYTGVKSTLSNPRNMISTLIDSSSNGYGLISGNTRPIDEEAGKWVISYRQYSGVGTTHGQLGAAISNDIENGDWILANNVNQNGNPPWGGGGLCADGTCAQARYPSVVATADYPYAIWNEYTAAVSTYGGRPYYSSGEYPWASLWSGNDTPDSYSFTYPQDIYSSWGVSDSHDLWASSAQYTYNLNNETDVINIAFQDWTRGNWIYLVRSETELGISPSFADEQLIFSSDNLGVPYLSINDNGQGVIMSIIYNTEGNNKLQFRTTNDYGVTWSNGIYQVPDQVLNDIFLQRVSPYITDTNGDGYGDTFIEYCYNYDQIGIDYDADGEVEFMEEAESYSVNSSMDFDLNGADVRIDPYGRIHIIAALNPVTGDPSGNQDILLIDYASGYYNLTIDINNISNPGDINTATGWNWSFLIDATDTWKYDVDQDTFSEIETSRANLSFSKDNHNIVWSVISIANAGDYISEEVEQNATSCQSWPSYSPNPNELSHWSYDLWVLKSNNRGVDWSDPINITETEGYFSDGVYNGPEEMYPHTPTFSTNDNVYFMYQTPNWGWNEIGDPSAVDHMNYVYIGYAGEGLLFTNQCENGVFLDNCGICGGDDSTCTGCMDFDAVNYNSEAYISDDSCIYANEINPHYTVSWSGAPNNPMAIYLNSVLINDESWRAGDEIGIFDEDICVGNIIFDPDFEGIITFYLSEDDPDTDIQDGFIAGNSMIYKYWDYSEQSEIDNIVSSSEENIFTPFGGLSVDLFAIVGCMDESACNYNQDATFEGSCIYIPESQCDCYGNVLDECGICNGIGPEENYDCEGNCIVDIDCLGECNGSAIIDECGICDGEGILDGYCDCENNILDECEVCGGDNSTCLGCTDQYALNYDQEAIVEDGSCEYPESGDFNNDLIFNIQDIVIMISYIFNDEYVFYADLNNDNFINIVDILMLVNWILE